MEPFIILIGIVALAFASTNMDNLLLLVGFQATRGFSRQALFGGYLLGMAGVLALALAIGLVGYLFPLEYLGYLGIIPILVGLRLLVVGEAAEQPAASAPAGGSMVTVAATQLSNGVDTVLVFAPLLADSQFIFDMEIALLFVVMVFVWYFLGRLLGRGAGQLRYVNVLGRWLAPLVMIVVGVYILGNTATDLSPL